MLFSVSFVFSLGFIRKVYLVFVKGVPSSFQFKDSIFGPDSLDQGIICKEFLASSSWLMELAVAVSSSAQPKAFCERYILLLRPGWGLCFFGPFSCFKSFSWFFSFLFFLFLICSVCELCNFLSTMSLST